MFFLSVRGYGKLRNVREKIREFEVATLPLPLQLLGCRVPLPLLYVLKWTELAPLGAKFFFLK